MDLKEFTKETILQVVNGVNDANRELAGTEASIPTYNIHNSQKYIHEGGDRYRNVVDLDFDVAIAATETEGAQGRAGIKVASLINIGGGVDSKVENQTISRIKFTLPLVLPKKINNNE